MGGWASSSRPSASSERGQASSISGATQNTTESISPLQSDESFLGHSTVGDAHGYYISRLQRESRIESISPLQGEESFRGRSTVGDAHRY
jgi:hypothetical protein